MNGTLVRTVLACPVHDRPLTDGPVVWHCPDGEHGHGVQAADLQREVTA